MEYQYLRDCLVSVFTYTFLQATEFLLCQCPVKKADDGAYAVMFPGIEEMDMYRQVNAEFRVTGTEHVKGKATGRPFLREGMRRDEGSKAKDALGRIKMNFCLMQEKQILLMRLPVS